MNRTIIGISLGNNTSACVVDPVFGVVFAISEERLINEKNTKKFPINAIMECMKFVGTGSPNFMLCHYEVSDMRSTKYIEDLMPHDIVQYDFYATLKKYLSRKLHIWEDLIEIRRVNHHESHKLAGLYLSGFLMEMIPTYSITYDGFGDGICASITNNNSDEVLSIIEPRHSLGLVYQFVTGALGFKEHQHEGKITGLAAFGKPIYVDEFIQYLFSYDPSMRCFVSNYDEKDMALFSEFNPNIHQFMEFLSLRKAVISLIDMLKREYGATREDIAASVQEFTEMMITAWATSIIKEQGPFNVVLSGGLFANVKVNYKLKKALDPASLFVLPPMGDEGNCIGAAIKGLILNYGENVMSLSAFAEDKMYYGGINGHLSYEEIYESVGHDVYDVWPLFGLDGSERLPVDELYQMLVDKIAIGKIVCLARGDSEFGPRALGNHTILYDCSKKETNDWLNKRLNRTEFMPFAPIVAVDFANDLFEDLEGLDKTLKYMTIAVPVKQEFIDNYKAAYHVDFTARPQVISESDNKFVYELLKRYHEVTDAKALINTSYNIHNFPIIANDHIAIDSFILADLDVLLLDNALIIKK